MRASNFLISRRRFLTTSTALAAGLGLPAWYLEETLAHAAPRRPLSANDRPRLALIGCGGQGTYDTKLATKFADVVAVCDVDERHATVAAHNFEGAQPYHDFRKLLERQDIDAVITATPDHWHTLVNIAALHAGKDVYSEKPLTLTITEGRKLVQVVQETKGILQTGSQQRSDARFRLACELVRNGRLGKLHTITTGLPTGPREGPFSPSPVPQGLDWDLWLGQTPKVDYVRERCHNTFRYWYEYSGGMMTDWGAHHNDIAQWGNGTERSGPVEVEGKSLVDLIPGGYTTASQYHVEYTYANGVKLICKSEAPDNTPNGVRFEGSEGWIFVDRGKITASRPELLSDPLPSNAVRLYHSDNHMGNFFECIRTRKPPICEAEIGHRSVSVCHLGVLSIRLGRKLKWDPAREKFVGDSEANRWLSRPMRAPWSYRAV